MADFVAPKDLAIDSWIDVLDGQIQKSIDPCDQWIKIRDYLLDNKVSTLTIANIENKYVEAVKSKSFDKLKSYVVGKDKDSKLSSIITEFMSSLCAKIITSSIGGV